MTHTLCVNNLLKDKVFLYGIQVTPIMVAKKAFGIVKNH